MTAAPVPVMANVASAGGRRVARFRRSALRLSFNMPLSFCALVLDMAEGARERAGRDDGCRGASQVAMKSVLHDS